MSLAVFLAVLTAALLHAGWNAAIKWRSSKVGGMLAMTLGQALIGLATALARPLPDPGTWAWIAASATIHAGYQTFLAWAYEHGDLSRVYPVARGTAPLLVLVIGGLVLPDSLAATEVAGILLLGAGILGMASGALRAGESRAQIPLALATAAATATYSMVDGTGARISGDAVAYVGWLLVLAAVIYTPVALAIRGRDVLPRPCDLAWGFGAGAASWGAYALVVWGMTQAPIALVAALRESSILFAVLIGWLLFGDRMTPGKWISAGLIVAGVALTRLG